MIMTNGHRKKQETRWDIWEWMQVCVELIVYWNKIYKLKIIYMYYYLEYIIYILYNFIFQETTQRSKKADLPYQHEFEKCLWLEFSINIFSYIIYFISNNCYIDRNM